MSNFEALNIKNMFQDIFNGKYTSSPSWLRSHFSNLSENGSLEMHYISRTGSLEIGHDFIDGGDDIDDDEGKHLNEDPMSGRLSAIDSALSTLPPHLIDKHWQWVTVLDLSRNHIE